VHDISSTSNKLTKGKY